MNKTVRIVGITLVAFSAYFALNEFFFHKLYEVINEVLHQKGISFLIAYILVGIPIIIGAALINKDWLNGLGLSAPILKGLVFALICTSPMLLGYASFFDVNQELTLNSIITGSIAAAFFEELYFRGFLFGQIHRYTRVGFIPAIAIGALLFGSVHLYQSQDFETIIGIFFATFFGAIWFAWLYAEWNYNLWVPIFLHLFMNLFWGLFSVSDNALGGNAANIFRLTTIALTIILTIVYKKRNGLTLEISKKDLWMKKKQRN